MQPRVRKALVQKAEQALQDLEAELAISDWRMDKNRMTSIAFGLQALTTANATLLHELDRLLGLYEKTGDWYQLIVWLRKVVAEEKAAL